MGHDKERGLDERVVTCDTNRVSAHVCWMLPTYRMRAR